MLKIKTYENNHAMINIDFVVCIIPCTALTTTEKQEIADKEVDSYLIKMSSGESIKIKKEQYLILENWLGE